MTEIPEIKTGFMGERVFAESKIPKSMVLNHHCKIFEGMMYSMAALDEEFLNEYLEAHFAQRLIDNLKDLANKGYILRV